MTILNDLSMNTLGEDNSHGIFIVWPDAMSLVERIRMDLASQVTILADREVFWSDEQQEDNLRRLYKQPLIFGDKSKYQPQKITGNEFHVFYICETKSPKIVLNRSASGEIERSSSLLTTKKELYRSWANEISEFPYLIHSATTQEEITLQSSLIFGLDESLKLQKNQKLDSHSLKNLAGTEGWKNLKEAFEYLSYCTDWCVLRGWETLPEKVTGDDLDILVRKKNVATSVLGLKYYPNDKYLRNGYLTLKSGELIKFDLHWFGDDYFDIIWQNNMLESCLERDGVRYPNTENAFFSLLYNEFINRPEARPERIDELASFVHKIEHSGWLTNVNFENKEALVSLLSEYMVSNSYIWVEPLIKRHEQPSKNVKSLPKHRFQLTKRQNSKIYNALAKIAKRYIPDPILKVIAGLIQKKKGGLQ